MKTFGIIVVGVAGAAGTDSAVRTFEVSSESIEEAQKAAQDKLMPGERVSKVIEDVSPGWAHKFRTVG